MKRLKFFWRYLSNKNPKIGKKESTPLHFVAYYGLSDVADFMLEELQSAEDCFPTNDSDKTPLHYASINGHAEIIKSLRRKIDFEFINTIYFKESLYAAIKYGHLECVKALLENQTSDFRKNISDVIIYRDLNPIDIAKDFYSKTNYHYHYKIVKYLS